MEPVIVANVASGTVDEFRSWFEYCNAPKETKYGAMRAKNGHPEPYNVRFWGIGNTDEEAWKTAFNPYVYAGDYIRFRTALDGNFTASGDGITSTNYETELVGYVEINGGTLNITSDDEAIQGVSRVTINGGTTNITANNNGIKCANVIEFKNGTVVLDAVDNALDALDITVGETASVTINGTPYVG